MSYPKPTPIFHITSIKNLERILTVGELQSKVMIDQLQATYCNVAHESIQDRRSTVRINKGTGGTLHDYVPFYFAPRSPMLDAIRRGNVSGCNEPQEAIAHFMSYAEAIDSARLSYVFTNGHAIMQPLEIFNSLADIDKIDWEILLEPPLVGSYAKYWMDKYDPGKPKWADRKRRRQAEFLVYQKVPWPLIQRIGVMTESTAHEINKILKKFGLNTPVEVIKDWYYT